MLKSLHDEVRKDEYNALLKRPEGKRMIFYVVVQEDQQQNSQQSQGTLYGNGEYLHCRALLVLSSLQMN